MDRLGNAVNDFCRDISRVKHLLRLVVQLRALGASLIPDMFWGGAIEWDEAIRLWGQANAHRTDLPLVAGSLLLYLTGRFEHFARITLELAAEEMAAGCAKFSELPDQLRTELVRRTAEVVQKPKRFGYDENQAEGFILALADALRAHNSVSITNSQCLSTTDTNLRAEALANLFKRIGLSSIWAEIGKQTRIKLHFFASSDQEATRAAQNRLDGLIEERNSIAHPTGETAFSSPEQVIEAAEFLELLAGVLVDVVRVHIAAFSMRNKSQVK